MRHGHVSCHISLAQVGEPKLIGARHRVWLTLLALHFRKHRKH